MNDVLLGRGKVDGFQTLSKKLMIFGPKNHHQNFSLQIRSKSARVETRAGNYNGYDLRCSPSWSQFWFEQIYFELKAEIDFHPP